MPALDLGGHRRNQVDHARKAVTWSEMWIGLALVFMAMIWLSLGRLFTDG